MDNFQALKNAANKDVLGYKAFAYRLLFEKLPATDSVVAFGKLSELKIVAQPFISDSEHIATLTLEKKADSGVFTGEVVVSIVRDFNGSPSDSLLWQKTLSNSDWAAIATGAFTLSVDTQVMNGQMYWIKLTTSTYSDTEHPNLGVYTSGFNFPIYVFNSDTWEFGQVGALYNLWVRDVSKIYQEYRAIGDSLNDFTGAVEDLQNQYNFDTMTWGCAMWEDALDITPREGSSYAERVEVIRSIIRSRGITMTAMKDLVYFFTGEYPEVVEGYKKDDPVPEDLVYFYVLISRYTPKSYSLESLSEAIAKGKPARCTFDIFMDIRYGNDDGRTATDIFYADDTAREEMEGTWN